MIVSGLWQPFYFTLGIPIYRKSNMLKSPIKPSPEKLNDIFSKGMSTPILFRQISNNQIAFREALFSFSFMSYTPVMHGLIQYYEGEFQVVGLANWFAPAFLISFIVIGSNLVRTTGFGLLFVIFPVGLFAFLYFIQYKRFTKVYDILNGSGEYKG